jgi:hypothetical protein
LGLAAAVATSVVAVVRALSLLYGAERWIKPKITDPSLWPLLTEGIVVAATKFDAFCAEFGLDSDAIRQTIATGHRDQILSERLGIPDQAGVDPNWERATGVMGAYRQRGEARIKWRVLLAEAPTQTWVDFGMISRNHATEITLRAASRMWLFLLALVPAMIHLVWGLGTAMLLIWEFFVRFPFYWLVRACEERGVLVVIAALLTIAATWW